MQAKPAPSVEATNLRRRAEQRLKEQRPAWAPDPNEEDTQRLVHELQVHQIELELQNEELQRAMEQVEAGMEKYTDLYDFAPVGYVTLDPAGAICEANLACATLLGIERSRLIKRRLGLFVSAADLPVFNSFLKKVFGSQAGESCEVSLLKEGKTPIAVRIEAVAAASGRECRAVVRDITERMRAEADRLLVSKLESVGILAGGIAHDFNNLLTVILLNVELGQMLSASGMGVAEHLEEAKKATLLARSLTQQIITFAKGGTPVRSPMSLCPVIKESTQLALSGSRVRCEFQLADELWPAEVDEGQIGQVIRNMVLNAREAMPRGGAVTIQASNEVLGKESTLALPPGEYVRVSIADQGRGIPKEVLPKIFDPYFSTKQRGDQKGMGLGLTICYSAIQKHGGAIRVESEPAAGTTFHIYLPASRSPILPEHAAVPTVPARHGRILLMDDEAGVRNVVAATLRRMGHEVELAEDGAKAIELFNAAEARQAPFDVVILDLTVRGGMGGQEAMQALLRIDPTVNAVVISGYANDPVILEYERYGFKAALAKPLDMLQLQETLSQVMQSDRTPDPQPKRR
jgi:two-component system, cell cycle sensor histidine kinase and response regulator CckA